MKDTPLGFTSSPKLTRDFRVRVDAWSENLNGVVARVGDDGDGPSGVNATRLEPSESASLATTEPDSGSTMATV